MKSFVAGAGLALIVMACGDAPEVPADAGADAGIALDAGQDAGVVDVGPWVDAGPMPTPESVLFIGNSFTNQGPIPVLVEDLMRYAGFNGFGPVRIQLRAIDGFSLEAHRTDTRPTSAALQIAEDWDVVVLQEFSTRPTDQVGPSEQFKANATWFYDQAKSVNPDCNVVLFETWARRHGHDIYPQTFEDPSQMQDELRFHYYDAAYRYIPTFSTAARRTDARVAPVGDAWAAQLLTGEPPRLHADDSYHGGPAGQYLTALVLYSTLFARRADGQVPLNGLDESTALQLQAVADEVTGATGWGARLQAPATVPIDDPIRIDLGPTSTTSWPALRRTTMTIVDLSTQSGAPTDVYATSFRFSGTEAEVGGVDTLDLPAEVGGDSLWVGTFDGHEAALEREGRVVLRGLSPGRYQVRLYARRSGNDAGLGRRTRYRIADQTRDLEVSNNESEMATFDDLQPDARGEIVVRVGVSPEGTARFADLGAMWVTRTQ